jgi:hypothetical protein
MIRERWQQCLDEVKSFCDETNSHIQVIHGSSRSDNQTLFRLEIHPDHFVDIIEQRKTVKTEAELRSKNPALQEVYDKYLMLLTLIKETK